MKEWIENLFKNFIGPALFAAVLVYGYWSYQTIQVQKEAIEKMSQALSGQCKVMLEQQGFSVTKEEVNEKDSK